MKKYILFIAFGLLLGTANAIDAYVTNTVLFAPGIGPYVETHLSIAGKSLELKKNAAQKLTGAVEVTMLFKQEDKIIKADKYILNSPEFADSSAVVFLADQKRTTLPKGVYTVEVKLRDINRTGNEKIFTLPVIVDIEQEKLGISDIQLLESYKSTTGNTIFTKNGLELMPYLSNFYPTEVNKITFYSEIYNSDKLLGKDASFLSNFSIKKKDSKDVIFNLNRFAKQTAQPVNVVLSEFDITDLPSGNYDLVIELKDKQNTLIAQKKIFFQRSNKNALQNANNLELIDIVNTFVADLSTEDLILNIKSLRPIAETNELKYIDAFVNRLKSKTPRADRRNLKLLASNLDKEEELPMRRFLLNFWTVRHPSDPRQAWIVYQDEVKKVDLAYGTQLDYGFETDRGRIRLKYGPPNQIINSQGDGQGAPYDMWQYYATPDNQRNVKFIFSNDKLTNDYKLIHSTAKGEINNPDWERLSKESGQHSKEMENYKR